MTIRETIKKGMINLKTNGIEEPNLKARLLMQFILNKPRQYLLIYDNQTLSLRQEVNYFKAIKKIISGVPLQHITHMQEFMKMNFYVDENVLIPRSDTEILVEEVINISKKINAKKILDLCTGSGAIAISLARYIENSEITAVDISKKALEIARTNAKNNDVENQITFVESDLFKNLKEDKYDVIGSRRTSNSGAETENNQTLNQLLVEMDGFSSEETIIVLAATNRPEMLDKALLRPGRFDRQITIPVPDLKGRLEILKIHARDKKISDDVNLESIAEDTAGFTGAELENILNEAAIVATKNKHEDIENLDIEEAVKKVTVGLEKRGRVYSEKDKKLTALIFYFSFHCYFPYFCYI